MIATAGQSKLIQVAERPRDTAVAKFKAKSFYDPTFIDELRKEVY